MSVTYGMATAPPENGPRRTCSQVHRGSEKHDMGLRRTGRLGCCRADCHSHADPAHEKGTVPFFKG
jgi:hypothetical protein